MALMSSVETRGLIDISQTFPISNLQFAMPPAMIHPLCSLTACARGELAMSDELLLLAPPIPPLRWAQCPQQQ